jgi:hypothetical protein
MVLLIEISIGVMVVSVAIVSGIERIGGILCIIIVVVYTVIYTVTTIELSSLIHT